MAGTITFLDQARILIDHDYEDDAADILNVQLHGTSKTQRRCTVRMLEKIAPTCVSAMAFLGRMLLEGEAVPRDLERGVALLELAASGMDVEMAGFALRCLGDLKAGMFGGPIDLRAALNHYEMAADLGDPESAHRAGLAWGKGVGVPEIDLEKAERFFRMAVEGGEPEAMVSLAILLTLKSPIPLKEIIELLDMAADMDNEAAQEMLNVLSIKDEAGCTLTRQLGFQTT